MTVNPKPHWAQIANPIQHVVIAAVLVFVTTCAVFWRCTNNLYTNLDDIGYVLGNDVVRRGLTLDGLRWSLSTPEHLNWHPLTWWSHMLDVTLFGMEPFGHHLVSVLWHAVAATLLLIAVWQSTRHLTPSALGCAVIVALAFALHPLRVESVAWLSERKDVLCAAFWLGTVVVYTSHHHRAPWARALAVLLALCALAAKPMAVTIPVSLLILDIWPLQRIQKWQDLRFSVTGKIPLFIVAVAVAIVTVVQQAPAMRAGETLDLLGRLRLSVAAVGRYLWMMAWPAEQSVSHSFASHFPSLAEAALAGVVVVAAALVAWRYRRPYPMLGVGLMWYIVTLAPVSGIIPVGLQTVADRYTYVPSIGVVIALVFWADRAVQARPIRIALTGAVVGILVVWSALTWRAIPHWYNGVSLWRHAAEADPTSPFGESQLAQVLASLGQTREAVAAAERAVAIRDDVRQNELLGVVLLRDQRPREAISAFERAQKFEPTRAHLYEYTAKAYHALGDFESEGNILFTGLQIATPVLRVLVPYAAWLLDHQRAQEAEPLLKRALRLDPTHPETLRVFDRYLALSEPDPAHRQMALERHIDEALAADAHPVGEERSQPRE